MNSIKIFSLVLITLFSNISFSQTVDPDWGPNREMERGTYFQKIAGYDRNGYFLVRSNSILEVTNEKIYLEFYSSISHDMESIGEIILPTISGVMSSYFDLFYLNEKIILFTTVVQGSQKTLYVQYLNQDGSLRNKPKEVASIPANNFPRDNFNVKVLPDSRLFIHYNNSFMQYNGEPFTYKILNSNLIEDFSEKVELPLKERTIEVLQTEILSNNMVVHLIKSPATVQRRTGPEVFDHLLLVFNPRSKEFAQITIDVAKYTIDNLIFGIDAEENITIGGFIYNRTRRIANEFVGVFYQTINPRTHRLLKGEDAKTTTRVFDRPFINSLATGRNGDEPDQYLNYKFKDIIFFDNKGIAFIAENSYQTSRTMINPRSKEETIINYYFYNDLLVYGVNKDGVLDWFKIIPKNQESLDDLGYHHSYKALKNLNQVKILYNDLPSNFRNSDPEKTKVLKNNPNTATVRGQAIMVSIFADGSFEKYPLFPDKDSKVCIIPKLIIPSGRRILTGCQDGRTIRFGTFVFE